MRPEMEKVLKEIEKVIAGKREAITMILTALLLSFLESGAQQIATDFGLNKSFSDILTGIILFFIIGCEFFVNYEIKFNKSSKEVK